MTNIENIEFYIFERLLYLYFPNLSQTMKKMFPFFLFFLLTCNLYAQGSSLQTQVKKSTILFANQDPLALKLSYSNFEIRRKTNDSTFLKINLSYQVENEQWKMLQIQMRKRGGYRLENCYMPPIKIKIDKVHNKGTLFEGNKKLKLVLPCSTGKSHNSYIIKEYMAYKLYELISPYHFNTRFVRIDFTEIKGNKSKQRALIGFLKEDIKRIAKRFDGKEIKRYIHPLNQEAISSVRNAFFQFMIGNVDFSTASLHNEKLIYIDKKIIPVPYDFDLSGLVNASYAFVPAVNESKPLPIMAVTERLYRGFKRDPDIMESVRSEFLQNKEELLQVVDDLEPLFETEEPFKIARSYIISFFKIIESDEKFKNQIFNKMRAK